MTPALAAAAPALFDPAKLERPDGGLTLEQRLERVWEGLCAEGTASCPLCGDLMTGARDSPASCGGCGSKLA